jgi:hypothetical protein
MNDLILVGNISVDKRVIVNTEHQILRSELSIGALANVARTLEQESCKYDMYSTIGDDWAAPWIHQIYPRIISQCGNTSNVLIIQNGVKRSHFVDWQNCKRFTQFPKRCASWCHIAYLDNLDLINAAAITAAGFDYGAISADLCLDNGLAHQQLMKVIECAEKLEILFLDSRGFYGKYIDAFKAKLTIAHSPENVSIYEKGKLCYHIKTQYHPEWGETLGAGDMLVAHVIKHLKWPSKETIEQAVNETYRDLKVKNA